MSNSRVASIAVFNAENQLLMGKRNDNSRFTLPGGHADEGEDIKAAARRELKEEAGLEPEELELIGSAVVTKNRGGQVHVYAFRCRCDDKPDSSADPDNEVTDWQWVDVAHGVPDDIMDNLHSRRNVTLQALGLQTCEGEEEILDKGEAWESFDLAKMALADVQPGIRMPSGRYDYTHLLPEEHRKDFRLVVEDKPSEATPGHQSLAAILIHRKRGNSGSTRGTYARSPDADGRRPAVLGMSSIIPHFRGKGIGPAMYEAFLAHAMSRGATHAEGDEHSSNASSVHRKIAAKHGMSYEPRPNPNTTMGDSLEAKDVNTGAWDFAKAPYSYALKSEDIAVKPHPKLGMWPELNFRVVSDDGQNVQLSRHADADYGPSMPKASVKHFVNDLSGRVDLPPSGHPHIDAVTSGQAEFVGKGDDGLVFKSGDKAVKVSTTVPYQPENQGHRSPEEAADQLEKQTATMNRLHAAGVPGVLPAEFVRHGDKGFQIKPFVETPKRFSQEQLSQVRDAILGMHKAGYVLGDTIQAGIGPDGKAMLFDTGKARQADTKSAGWDSPVRDDLSYLASFFREHGGDYHAGQPTLKSEDVKTQEPEEAQPRYLYHVTYHNRLPSIADNGLQPDQSRSIGGGGYDGHARGKLFFSDAEGTKFWHSRAEDHAEHNSDNIAEDGLVPMVLRVAEHHLGPTEVDEAGGRDSLAEAVTTKQPVQPHHIQYFDGIDWTNIHLHGDHNHMHAIRSESDGHDEHGEEQLLHYFKENSPFFPEEKHFDHVPAKPLPAWQDGSHYPKAGATVDGFLVGDKIDNMASIGATLNRYTSLGVRELPFEDFCDPKRLFYAADDHNHAAKLAEAIKASGKINPLIVVHDKEGPYILEGAHRFVALHHLGAKTFPALVVRDDDSHEPMQKFAAALDFWYEDRLEKMAIDPKDTVTVGRAHTDKGRDFVDHTPDMEAGHEGSRKAFKELVLDKPEVVKRTAARGAGTSNASAKAIWKTPAGHFMAKAYHEKPAARTGWVKFPIQGWAEMTNQALYHAADIGDLHQNVHVADIPLGAWKREDKHKEPKVDQALIVHFAPGAELAVDMNTRSLKDIADLKSKPHIREQARKIALMDFLSGNLDRHHQNLMHVPSTDSLLAVDHSRSFQYTQPFKWEPSFTHQPGSDSLYNYVSGPGAALSNIIGFPKNNSLGANFYHDEWMQTHDDWRPTFEWWAANKDKVAATFNERLKSIKNDVVRKHLQTHFEARHRQLSQYADFGTENFGADDWAHSRVDMEPAPKLAAKLLRSELATAAVSGYPPYLEEDMTKSLKHKLWHLAAATALAVTPVSSATHDTANDFVGPTQNPAAPPIGGEPPKPWTPHGLPPEMHPIAHMESSFGRNLNHEAHSKGDFHTAYGAVGFKPVTAHFEYKKSPAIQKMFPGLQDEQKFIKAFKKDHHFYNVLAGKHFNWLKTNLGGDVHKAAYGWRWGIGAAQRAADEDIAADGYVRQYQVLANRKPADVRRAIDAGLKKNEVWAEEVLKGADHKYLRRIPTGQDKPKYRYIYATNSSAATRDIKTGEKLKIDHRGQAGHYEVKSVSDDGKVVMRHDESGHEIETHIDDVHKLFVTEHKHEIRSTHKRLKSNLSAARKHGTLKQKLIAEQAFNAHKALYKEILGPRAKTQTIKQTFESKKEAYEGIKAGGGIEDHDSLAQDVKYEAWLKDKVKNTKPPPFEGGHFDAVNEQLDLKGDKRVSCAREAFDKLTTGVRTWAGLESALEIMRSVPGFENASLPEAVAEKLLDEKFKQHQEAMAAEPAPEVYEDLDDTSFDFGANIVDYVKGLKKSQPLSDILWWHSSPSGDLRGGPTGLHLGTRLAAEQALHSRIGYPVDGQWDGTREYGKTKLCGRKTLTERGIPVTGYNCDAPDEDHFPTGKAIFGDGTPVLPEHKPTIAPMRLVGAMTNTPNTAHADFKANGMMAGQLKRGNAKSGYYYKNDGEDVGSVSIVVPNGSHVQPANALNKSETVDSEHAPARAKIVPWLQSRGVDAADNDSVPHGLGETLATMLGGHSDELRRAAQILSGRRDPIIDVKAGEDPIDDMLRAYGIQATKENRLALAALVSEFLHKTEDVGIEAKTVTAVFPEGQSAAEGIQEAFLQGLVYEVRLGGKHSKGVMLAMDGTDPALPQYWLLKPGSGRLSPAAGIRELAISQSRREASFAYIARRMLPADFPETELVVIGDQEVAAIKVLAKGYVAAQRVKEDAAKIFGEARHDGRLYMWAALDYVLGNVDRHGGNVLIGPDGQLALIDHGSTLAGDGFAPSHDAATYVPYYLRSWCHDWKQMNNEERRQKLPAAGDVQESILQAFLPKLEVELQQLQRLAPPAYAACVVRLHRLMAAPRAGDALLDAWMGIGSGPDGLTKNEPGQPKPEMPAAPAPVAAALPPAEPQLSEADIATLKYRPPSYDPDGSRHEPLKAQLDLVNSLPHIPPDIHAGLIIDAHSDDLQNAAIDKLRDPQAFEAVINDAPYPSYAMASRIIMHPNLPVEQMKSIISKRVYPWNTEHIWNRQDITKEVVAHALHIGAIPHGSFDFWLRHVSQDPELVNAAITSPSDTTRVSALSNIEPMMSPEQKIAMAFDFQHPSSSQAASASILTSSKFNDDQKRQLVAALPAQHVAMLARRHGTISPDLASHGALHNPDNDSAAAFVRDLQPQHLTPELTANLWNRFASQSDIASRLILSRVALKSPTAEKHVVGPQMTVATASSLAQNPAASAAAMTAIVDRLSSTVVNDDAYASQYDKNEALGHVAKNPNTDTQTLTRLLGLGLIDAVKHPNMPVEELRRIADAPDDGTHGHKFVRAKAREALAAHEPDYAFEESVNVALDVGRIRKVRDAVLEAKNPSKVPAIGEIVKLDGYDHHGPDFKVLRVNAADTSGNQSIQVQTPAGQRLTVNMNEVKWTPPAPKDVHKNALKHHGIELTPFTKPGSAHVDADKLQAAIDAAPRTKYNISHSKWGGMQRHNNEHSRVLQVNLTTDHVKKLKAAGLMDTYKRMQEETVNSDHPVHQDHGIGWVRYTRASKPVGDEECETCAGQGSVPGDPTCHQCDGGGTEEQTSECQNCDGRGKSTIDCETCDGSGAASTDAEGNDVKCSDCDGTGIQETECGDCSGQGEITEDADCSECNGTGEIDYAPDEDCPECDRGRVPIRGTPAGKDSDHIFVDEAQSDFGQHFGSQILANTRDAFVERGRANGLKGAELKAYINENMSKAHEIVDHDFPPERTKAVADILFGGRHSNEVLAEAFFQHLRDQGYHGSEIRWHSVDSKAPISLGHPNRTKWIDPKAKNARVDLDDEMQPIKNPSQEQRENWKAAGYIEVKDIPGHFQETYARIPQKVLGLEERAYGTGPNENGHLVNEDDGGGGGNPHLGGAKIWGDRLRRGERKLVFSELIKNAAPLKKAVLDPALGYRLEYVATPMVNFYAADAKNRHYTVHSVNAYAANGEKVGAAHFDKEGDSLEPAHVFVHEAHRRQGLASAMYAHAEQATGMKIAPSKARTNDGLALWAGNQQRKQFGE